ncbi:hypothetical protein MG293_012545 [Ovis ammon polii]|uniref:Sodium channel regulatory subunit beta-3 n=1 Tax=Ovis ammon polii TaxID=230172 RepID=A0AAD4U3L4_OVIAM|nr:hypothetical protein MG293_012545 [Ovis ammon polii]
MSENSCFNQKTGLGFILCRGGGGIVLVNHHCSVEVPVLQDPALPEERNPGNSEMVALLTALSQGLVTFKDVAVCFSQDQWSDLDPTQKEFYGEYVLEEDCGIVVSLSFPIPRLDELSHVREEEPLVPEPQEPEEPEILSFTYTGDRSDDEEERPEQEDLSLEDPHRHCFAITTIPRENRCWPGGQEKPTENTEAVNKQLSSPRLIHPLILKDWDPVLEAQVVARLLPSDEKMPCFCLLSAETLSVAYSQILYHCVLPLSLLKQAKLTSEILFLTLKIETVGICFPVCVEVPSETEAVQGNPMKLRCISCMKREEVEATTVVEWFYRPEGGKDFLIYEYRNGHQEVESPFQGRLQWNGSKDLQDVSITVLNVTLNDSGLYTCNVSREFEFEAHRPFVKTTRLIPLRVTEEGHDAVPPQVQRTESVDLGHVPHTCADFYITQAGEDFTSVVSEIMMYILLVFLTLWLLIEMIYCYRKVSKAEEAAQENASDYLAIPSENKENSAVPVEE